jgi:hypothetical protein
VRAGVAGDDIVSLREGETERFADQRIVIDDEQERLGSMSRRNIPDEILFDYSLSFPATVGDSDKIAELLILKECALSDDILVDIEDLRFSYDGRPVLEGST